jgi:PIN domain nuclease of toxin-antitoxin system
VIVWLYAGLVESFTQPVRELMNALDITISPIVRLELQYLFEIEKISSRSDTIIADLASRIGLRICDKDFNAIMSEALRLDWTRDPFDRVIVANANLNDNLLISKDESILDHYPHARW